ncbi:RNA polymerase sigma factor [Gemmatimonas sp.]
MIEPLRKRTLAGELYKRDARIEVQLVELAALPPDELVARCSVTRPDTAGYVFSECLLYFVRSYRGKEVDTHYERLYRLLAARVLHRLPDPNSADGETVSLSRTTIREAAFDRFVELLASDRTAYSEKLDYYETRFDGAIASLRKDAQDKVWREARRVVAFESEATGAPSTEVEYAALEQSGGDVDPFDLTDVDEKGFRLRFDAAIDALAPDHRRVVQLLRLGIPIDSQDPSVLTIAKALGRSGRTIQTYRDKAFAALRAALPKDAP